MGIVEKGEEAEEEDEVVVAVAVAVANSNGTSEAMPEGLRNNTDSGNSGKMITLTTVITAMITVLVIIIVTIIGLVLEPVFSHQKGQTFLAQHAAVKMLADQNLMVDSHFSLQFDTRPDQREGRPNNYPGRIVHGIGVKEAAFKFRTSDLARVGRTELAQMLAGKDMVEVDETPQDGDNILPPDNTTAESFHVGPRGAKRVEQIGVDACAKLMDSVLNKVNPELWIFVSLNPGPGHDLQAFLHRRASATQPCYYFGLVDSTTHADVLQKRVVGILTNELLAGSLKLAGVPLPQKDFPKELQSEPLVAPSLHVLKIGEDKKARIPQQFYSQWAMHERFCTEFKDQLLACQKILNYEEPLETMDENVIETPSRKRTGEALETPTPQKRMKQASLPEPLASEDVPNPPLATIPMSTAKQAIWKLVLTGSPQNPTVYMLNSGSVDISFQQGNIIAAYGKIKWRFATSSTPDEDLQPNEIPYTLTDSNTCVFHDNKRHD